jgi:hypothetical protein
MSLAHDALEAFDKGALLQSKVRKFIETTLPHSTSPSEIASLIAEEMGVFRGLLQTQIDEEDDPKTRTSMIRRANNIVGDVSRITREEIGLTIKLKSRKGGFVYTAREPTPRTPKTPKPKLVPHNVVERLVNLINLYPQEILGSIMSIHGDEMAGEMVADLLRKDSTERCVFGAATIESLDRS